MLSVSLSPCVSDTVIGFVIAIDAGNEADVAVYVVAVLCGSVGEGVVRPDGFGVVLVVGFRVVLVVGFGVWVAVVGSVYVFMLM